MHAQAAIPNTSSSMDVSSLINDITNTSAHDPRTPTPSGSFQQGLSNPVGVPITTTATTGSTVGTPVINGSASPSFSPADNQSSDPETAGDIQGKLAALGWRLETVRTEEKPIVTTRPANSFILYRRDKSKEITKLYPTLNQSAVSRMVADLWRRESAEIREKYRQMQHQAKQDFEEQLLNSPEKFAMGPNGAGRRRRRRRNNQGSESSLSTVAYRKTDKATTTSKPTAAAAATTTTTEGSPQMDSRARATDGARAMGTAGHQSNTLPNISSIVDYNSHHHHHQQQQQQQQQRGTNINGQTRRSVSSTSAHGSPCSNGNHLNVNSNNNNSSPSMSKSSPRFSTLPAPPSQTAPTCISTSSAGSNNSYCPGLSYSVSASAAPLPPPPQTSSISTQRSSAATPPSHGRYHPYMPSSYSPKFVSDGRLSSILSKNANASASPKTTIDNLLCHPEPCRRSPLDDAEPPRQSTGAAPTMTAHSNNYHHPHNNHGQYYGQQNGGNTSPLTGGQLVNVMPGLQVYQINRMGSNGPVTIPELPSDCQVWIVPRDRAQLQSLMSSSTAFNSGRSRSSSSSMGGSGQGLTTAATHSAFKQAIPPLPHGAPASYYNHHQHYHGGAPAAVAPPPRGDGPPGLSMMPPPTTRTPSF
ncbi:hypothetical protein H4219_004064 [Mycoemilia scoparia]|uniref:HMG box domain-containing protein n=1 Tax=Mycoemilia scoparia TaxID=417184 RepID=A0A9W7ZYP1_9FUNG|nr:hypothetical protein H4219_004064 [Mycoemilia scoparia]